jgi:CheY-like chemotaxis protein
MNGLRVLIVEDEVIIAWDLRETLERLGNEVLPIAAAAGKAVEQARAAAPDLILMDITLRGERTGIDAALEIREFSDVPIFYVTGNSHLLHDLQMIRTHAQGVYAKPPSEDQIQEMLEIARRTGGRGIDGNILPE